MAKHPPAHRREILRRLKAGEHPADLLKEAATIDDPGHAAGALFVVAADRRVPSAKAGEVLADVRRMLRKVDRPGRIAEAWGEILADLPEWRPGQHEMIKDDMLQTAVRAVDRMPNGQWTLDAVTAMAPHVGATGRAALLRRAIKNVGFEVPGGKAVLRAATSHEIDGLVELIDACEPTIASGLHAFLANRGKEAPDAAIKQAWAIDDGAARAEALRVLAWNCEDANGLDQLARSVSGQPDEEAVRLLTVVAARADRLGLPDASARFARAQTHAHALPEGHKLRRKLHDAMRRAGIEAPDEASAPVPEPSPEPEPASRAVEVVPATRHTLAIVDGYQGGLGLVHIRAVARAAPLCAAFGLDLALVGFPTERLEEITTLVEAESNIGEGGDHARALLEAGRLHLVPLEGGLPASWPGRPVATTPHPKGASLDGIDGFHEPICLLVGLGRNGLPKRILNTVPDHYELTGQGISLETATAMGILADRLGRVRLPA